MNLSKKFVLIIVDGVGINDKIDNNFYIRDRFAIGTIGKKQTYQSIQPRIRTTKSSHCKSHPPGY